jgi:hypothetical protein
VPLSMQESIRRIGCRLSSRETKSRQPSDRLRLAQTACSSPCLWVRSCSSRLRVVLIFKYSAARRLRRREILDQRGSAWKWTEPSHTFSASEVSIRQANIVCDLLEPRELSCATEELRQLLVQLVESDTFSRWLPISRHDVDPSFSYSPGGASGSLGRSKSAVRSATSTCSAKGESVKGVSPRSQALTAHL